jgi:DNA-3-methyladenine glycosylase II
VPEQSEALAHLRKSDKRMKALIDRFEKPEEVLKRRGRRPTDAYGALLRAIVGQQLSTKAARSIYGRLLDYFDGDDPAPRQILDADPEEMRAAAGLSRSKVSFLRDLAEHVEDGELDLTRIAEPWRPHRSLACLYLWRSLDNAPD